MAVQAVGINMVGLGRADENSSFVLYLLQNTFTQQ
jgi:hypothetical protein